MLCQLCVCLCACVVFGCGAVTTGLQRFAKDNLGFYDAVFVFSKTHRRIKWKTSEDGEHHFEHIWQRRTGWEQHWSNTLIHAQYRGHEGTIMSRTNWPWYIVAGHNNTRRSQHWWERKKAKMCTAAEPRGGDPMIQGHLPERLRKLSRQFAGSTQ